VGLFLRGDKLPEQERSPVDLEPPATFGIVREVVPHLPPEVGGVAGHQQVGQFMDYDIIYDVRGQEVGVTFPPPSAPVAHLHLGRDHP